MSHDEWTIFWDFCKTVRGGLKALRGEGLDL
jgi:hypothetical protein